jgi:hypothetical protein
LQEHALKQRLLLIGVVLLLAIPLVLLLRDFTREILLVEVLVFVWTMRIIFGSLPQLPLWLLFILLILFIAVVSMLGQRKPGPEPPRAEVRGPGQIHFLARRIRRVGKGEYFQWDLARYVSGLVLDVLAYRQRTSASQLRSRLRTEGVDAPPGIQTYLRAGQSPIYTLSANVASRLKHLFSPGTRNPPHDQDIEQAVQFMEDQLEAQHDHRDR